MVKKSQVAFYWCASCGGCEEAVVDLAEKILDVVGAVDIVFWPVALDFKKKDVEAMADGSMLATFLNGGIRTTEQEEMARLLRRKSKLMVAFGSCSHLGGVPGLANLWDRASIFHRAYKESPSTVNPEGIVPQMKYQEDGRTATLPEFFDTVRSLDQVVEVDYAIPGCAPPANVVLKAVQTLLGGDLPSKGSVLGASDRALCEECPRKDTRPDKLTLKEFNRPHHFLIDEEKCHLAQGLLCMGPATRGGCGSLCVKGNMPCTGCFGPTDRIADFGAKALSAIASIIDCTDEKEIGGILSRMPDPMGTFYRYSLPGSYLRRKNLTKAAR